jgi:hypothetical protein|tara:strand:+ start:526 stop:708 length:183 start_codon:yes stop_codon:yes gene_type:complete
LGLLVVETHIKRRKNMYIDREYFESLVDELFKAQENRYVGDEDYIESLEQDIEQLEKEII